MIYLRKANDELVNHCDCGDGHISLPGQLDCPWCGCGWLFTCVHCRKAFTFAEAVEVDFTLEEMVRRDMRHWKPEGTEPDAEDVQGRIEFMREFLQDIELGCHYVYLDGVIIPADAAGLEFEGLHSAHDLPFVPQVEALRDRSIIRDLLNNPDYWHERALQSDESELSA